MGTFARMVGIATLAIAAIVAFTGFAAAGMGQPTNGSVAPQLPASVVADDIIWFYGYVTYIIIAITVFVLGLMAYVIFRYNENSNPNPSSFTHNTTIEFIWTVVPIVILIAIGIPSFKLLYLQYEYPKPDVVIKSVGNSWFWEHIYQDEDELSVAQNIVRDADIITAAIGQERFDQTYGELEGLERQRILFRDAAQYWAKSPIQRQLRVDNPIAVPVNKVVHVLITSNDVIHGWAVPALGSRVQAVPGRTTATWFKATKTGAFYGQCSVLCGQFHASMPIGIHVVTEDVYKRWLAAQKAGQDEVANKLLYDVLPQSDSAKVARLKDLSVETAETSVAQK
ncbi:MAG: cytochrome c oxidase subunit II [Pseudomonadota bacterium]